MGGGTNPPPRGSPVVLHHPLLVHPDPVRASRSGRPNAQLNKSTNPRADARAVDNREVPAMGSAVALGGVPVQSGALCMEAPRLILVPPPRAAASHRRHQCHNCNETETQKSNQPVSGWMLNLGGGCRDGNVYVNMVGR